MYKGLRGDGSGTILADILNEWELAPKHLLERAVEPVLSRMGHELRTETLSLGESFPMEIGSAFKLSRMIAETVRIARQNGWFPLVLSGNCNAAVGTVCGSGCETTAVVWFDAHGESTTPETTMSGFLDGMGIAIRSLPFLAKVDSFCRSFAFRLCTVAAPAGIPGAEQFRTCRFIGPGCRSINVYADDCSDASRSPNASRLTQCFSGNV